MILSTDDNIRLLIHYMARDGFDETEISKRLNLKVSYIKKLIKNDKDIIRDIEYAKLLTDYRVEDSLLKKALGDTVTETKTTEKGSGSETITNTKEVPADTSAIQFWLKNRCPDKWNEKVPGDEGTIQRLEKIFEALDKKAGINDKNKSRRKNNDV